MSNKSIPLAALSDRTDALLHFIPLLRKAVATMPEDDPQEHEDEHVKQVKEKTEQQKQTDGR